MRLLKLLARLTLPLLHVPGFVLGWLVYLAPGRDCKHLLRQSISEYGKTIIELLPLWLGADKKVLKWVRRTSGWEQIDAARAAGKGVILVAPHIGRPAYTPTLVASLQRKTGAAAIRINQGVEAIVRHFPAQYMWTYNRHKRPGGVALPGAPAAGPTLC